MAELKLLPQDKSNNTVIILKALSKGIVIASSVVAPNILSLLARDIRPDENAKTLRAVRYAKSQGWLTFRETSKGIEVALSESGKLKWQKIELSSPLITDSWDGKWRLVLFDIPVGKKQQADEFRQAIKRLGLKMLQKSVWVTPYPCQTQVALLRQSYGLKTNVRLIEASAIDDEVALKIAFGLPL